MKIIGITQARFGSSRLPGKVLKKVGEKTMLSLHLERALASKRLSKLIVATTDEPEAARIEEIAREYECPVYKGSVNDVLDRFYQAAKIELPDYVVRITSDCPLLDHHLMDDIIDSCIDGGFDYCSNTLEPTYPDGLDVEVFTFQALEKAWNEANSVSDREHVTPYIWRNSTFRGGDLFVSQNYSALPDFSHIRLTVDEAKDFELIEKLILALGNNRDWKDYVTYVMEHNDVFEINAHLKRNEGFMKSLQQEKIALRRITDFSKSNAYRKKIHNLIPGGAHTYSKGDDQFPELAPAAITHGKGAYVWDIDGNQFLDCSMGLTSVSLGHAYEPVLEAVRNELELGVNFQRPSALEMTTAEKFLSLLPQHEMIKFAKNGSIVTTAAVKLARAYTGRKLVAFPGNHPFYSYDDWFIGKTACNKGVPEEIIELSVTFNACDIESLKELFETYPNQIACVITEPEKSTCADSCKCKKRPDEFLREAIDLAHKNGALFIIDEMVSGFKSDFPGSMTKYNLKPDMATWGKGVANGFSFCALTGTKEVMQLGGILQQGNEKVFLISTTHGGETHAMAAANSTIDIFRQNDVIKHNHSIGDLLIKCCNESIKEAGLQNWVQIIPCNWLVAFNFLDNQGASHAGLRTLILQEMIKRGVLFQGAFAPCYSHSIEDVFYFNAAFRESLEIYKMGLEKGVDSLLVGHHVKPVFRKYL